MISFNSIVPRVLISALLVLILGSIPNKSLSKSSGGTNRFSTFSLFGPISPPRIPITLAI